MLLTYRRVSTTEQAAADKTSLEEQDRIARGFAMAKGFNQFDMASYEDAGVSASIPLRSRPAGARLLADAKPGDFIFATKLDRMFRSASDALNMIEIFKEKDIKLVLFDLGSDPVAESAMAQCFFTISAAFAQLERTIIRERMTGGKKAKKLKGGHAGGEAPYGFAIVGKGRDARLEPVESEQQNIARIKSWLSERAELSISETCRRLAQEGATTRTGKPFVKTQVSRIMDRLRNNG